MGLNAEAADAQEKILQHLTGLNGQQRELARFALGALGAVGIVAAFRNERFRTLFAEAASATTTIAFDTAQEIIDVLKNELPSIGERAVRRFGQETVSPLAEGLSQELQEAGLPENVSQAFAMLRRLGQPHPATDIPLGPSTHQQ